MAAKPEDFRVSELLSKGSKAIDKTRDKKNWFNHGAQNGR
jgi:hypothetical protein